jgi:hypothetical protein
MFFFSTGLKVDVFICRPRHMWTTSEIVEAEEATVLFAADVIYSDDLTDLFFDTVKNLMCAGAKKVLPATINLEELELL